MRITDIEPGVEYEVRKWKHARPLRVRVINTEARTYASDQSLNKIRAANVERLDQADGSPEENPREVIIARHFVRTWAEREAVLAAQKERHRAYLAERKAQAEREAAMDAEREAEHARRQVIYAQEAERLRATLVALPLGVLDFPARDRLVNEMADNLARSRRGDLRLSPAELTVLLSAAHRNGVSSADSL